MIVLVFNKLIVQLRHTDMQPAIRWHKIGSALLCWVRNGRLLRADNFSSLEEGNDIRQRWGRFLAARAAFAKAWHLKENAYLFSPLRNYKWLCMARA